MTEQEEELLIKSHVTLTEPGLKMDIAVSLAKLNDAYRELLTLRFVMGMSATEVGDVMNKSAGAVRVMQLRALKALKAQFDEDV